MNFVRRELHALAAAVMFFTRLPVPSGWGATRDDLQRAAAYFPLMGWIVGGAAALVWWLGSQVWSAGVASALSLTASLVLTGAFHEDGFADVCDGFGGGYTKERVLEIMRDSRVGAFGAIGVAVILLLKWQGTAALPPAWAPAAIVAGHALSRAAAGTLIAVLPYVRMEEGKAKPLATSLRGGRLVGALAAGVAPLALLPWRAAWGIATVGVVVAIAGIWFRRRIGGYTGDCLGAAQQVAEVAVLLTLSAVIA